MLLYAEKWRKTITYYKTPFKKRISMLCSHQNTEEIPTPTQLLLPQWQVWTPIPKSKAFNPDFCVANVDLKPIMTDNQKLFLLELPPNQKFQKYPKMNKNLFRYFPNSNLHCFQRKKNPTLQFSWISWVIMDPDQQFYKL